MRQQHLFQRQLNLASGPWIVFRERRVCWHRSVDPQDLDRGVAFEHQTRETRGWEEMEEIDFRRVRGVAADITESIATVSQAV